MIEMKNGNNNLFSDTGVFAPRAVSIPPRFINIVITVRKTRIG